MSTYDVSTERFGVVQYEADNIAQARAWARAALGVRNPSCVTLQRPYRRCEDCECAPCACTVAS